jgi:hypothetical protein
MLGTMPSEIYSAFSQAFMENPMNETSRRLCSNHDDMMRVAKTLRDLGQFRLINLSRSYEESRIVLAFYAGDGIVIKVIPEDFLGDSNVIYHLPAITARRVGIEKNRDFIIKAYPWLKSDNITAQDINVLKSKLAEIGLTIIEGDDSPRNIRRMPDKQGTLVGIDSAMYYNPQDNGAITAELTDNWHAYVHKLFPVYQQRQIKPQNEQTNFDFVSIHDRGAENTRFKPPKGPSVKTSPPKKPSASFFQSILDNLTLG